MAAVVVRLHESWFLVLIGAVCGGLIAELNRSWRVCAVQVHEVEIEKLRSLEMDKMRLERELSISLHNLSVIRTSLAEETENRSCLQAELASTLPTHAKKPNSISDVEIENNTLQLSLAEWKTKASRFESLLREMEERTELDSAAMREAALKQISELDSLKNQLLFATSQLHEANSKLANAAARNSVLEAELDILRDRKFLPENINDLIATASEISTIKSKIVMVTQEKLAAETVLADMKRTCEYERAANMSAQLDLVTLRNENASLRNRLSAAKREAESAGGNSVNLSNRCEELERRLVKKRDLVGDENEASTSVAGSIMSGTMDLLSAPIMPVLPLLGMSTSGTMTPQKSSSYTSGDYERDGNDSISPSGTVMSPVRSNKSELIRTHEKLRQKRSESGSAHTPPRSLSSTSPKREKSARHSGGVLAQTIIPLSKTTKTPTKSEFL